MTHFPNVRARAALACASLLVAGAMAAPAVASPALQVSAAALGEVTRTASVDISDLNLADRRGAARALDRLERAAAGVCGYNSMWGVRPSKDYQSCYDAALGAARPKLEQAVAEASGKRQQTALTSIR